MRALFMPEDRVVAVKGLTPGITPVRGHYVGCFWRLRTLRETVAQSVSTYSWLSKARVKHGPAWSPVVTWGHLLDR